MTHLEHPLHRPLRRSHRHPSHIQVMSPCSLQRRFAFFEIRSEPEGREERRVPLDGVVAERASVERDERALVRFLCAERGRELSRVREARLVRGGRCD